MIMKEGNSWVIEAMTLTESAQSVMQCKVIDGAVLSLFTGATSGSAASVPADSLAGTAKASSTVERMGFTMESTGWYSSSVSISGLVKSTDDDGNTITLLDFGISGAKSHLE